MNQEPVQLCRSVQSWPIRLGVVAWGLLFLAGCVSDPFYPQANSSQDSATAASVDDPASSPSAQTPNSPSSSSTAEFTFPQASCGDRASELNVTWYPVYIDGANIDDIRQKYCRDAVSTIRDKTNQPSVQVASFTSYEKALQFAKQVGGEVESTLTRPASTANGATPMPGASPYAVGATPTPSPTLASPSPSSSPTPAAASARVDRSLVGQSVYLNAEDPGVPINIREQASVKSGVQRMGYYGDQVQVSDAIQGDDGYTWYRIRFGTGSDGWVRSDLVSTEKPVATRPSGDRNASANSSTGSRSMAGTTAGSTAHLEATDPSSPINVREQASTDARVRYMGYAGDPIQIAEQAQGADGYTWYKVQFDSGATGWVRADFVAQ